MTLSCIHSISRTYNAACTYVDLKPYTFLSGTDNLSFKHVIIDQSRDANFLNKYHYFNELILDFYSENTSDFI